MVYFFFLNEMFRTLNGCRITDVDGPLPSKVAFACDTVALTALLQSPNNAPVVIVDEYGVCGSERITIFIRDGPSPTSPPRLCSSSICCRRLRRVVAAGGGTSFAAVSSVLSGNFTISVHSPVLRLRLDVLGLNKCFGFELVDGTGCSVLLFSTFISVSTIMTSLSSSEFNSTMIGVRRCGGFCSHTNLKSKRVSKQNKQTNKQILQAIVTVIGVDGNWFRNWLE